MFLTKSFGRYEFKQHHDALIDLVSEHDFDPLSYKAAITGIQEDSCNSRKTSKKIGPTPDKHAMNLHFKKKRRQLITKSRRSTVVYREFVRWK